MGTTKVGECSISMTVTFRVGNANPHKTIHGQLNPLLPMEALLACSFSLHFHNRHLGCRMFIEA